eukprot:CAMPEP_0114498752 /NCGR_PEP_ID=MMETSP0109-20121206/7043_1 /TAXON_ID=29199 /ORGANISM="Chlorarachnion reptans, Strain CCCM449" /LENGTH=362 /DNA_ID=CAMNT_0001676257 /DNA_START=179 /DNA_END=1267 /DNA_ORIENTATION=-
MSSPSEAKNPTASGNGGSGDSKEKRDLNVLAAFKKDMHVEFILGLDKKTDTFEYHVTEHLRMSGVYWGATCMDMLGELGKMDKKSIIKFVFDCYHECGGFSGNVNHDPHLLYTLSAVQILALFGEMGKLDKDAVAKYVAGLQQEDGSFTGDKWGEVDTRFSYCALNCLALLGKLDTIEVKKATDFVSKCRNFDGGYGAVPGAESHAGQIFCCVAALAIGNALDEIDVDLLGWWLCERQLPCGGLNGRPEKREDVCYSWWVLSALSILGKISWISREKLASFIIRCQDEKEGGISDRPENMPDVFHTFFGVAALSLLGFKRFKEVDPVFALPVHTMNNLGVGKLYPYQGKSVKSEGANDTGGA